jgi:hypothetical protein
MKRADDANNPAIHLFRFGNVSPDVCFPRCPFLNVHKIRVDSDNKR